MTDQMRGDEQGQIHGRAVADGWARAVMQPVAQQQYVVSVMVSRAAAFKGTMSCRTQGDFCSTEIVRQEFEP